MWNVMWRGSLADEFAGLQAALTGSVDYPGFRCYENAEGITLRAEIPGVSSESIGLEVTNNVVKVSIDRRPEDVAEDARIVRKERRSGPFSRSFELPFKADAGAVLADYANGVLTITVPKAEEEKPRRILVQAG